MAESADLKTLTKYERRRSSNQSRYERHVTQGMSVESIAKEDAVSVGTVRKSIELIKRQLEMSTIAEMERVQWAMVMEFAPKERTAIMAMLTATFVSEKGLVLPDHEVRARAVELISDRINAVKPKGTGPTTQVAVMTNPGSGDQSVSVTTSGGDFESILRNVHAARRVAQNEPLALGNGTPIDAEIVDPETEEASADSPAQG